ncbi:TPA_asm: hypothetical protein GD647_08355 [Campylobacter jejuni]|nr:hypothetical protein [Campylobacter jejuni]HAA1718418.1 hypothetical protein [Campylobacter jejuni]
MPTITTLSPAVIVPKFITFPALDLITGDAVVRGFPSNAEIFPSFANSFISLSPIDEADKNTLFALILPSLPTTIPLGLIKKILFVPPSSVPSI